MEMHNNLDSLTEEFRKRYDGMAQLCAEAEEAGRWDTEADGSMEGYAFAALSGAILSLIVSDGNVGERETDYLNRTFGFDYTVDDLLSLYRFSARDLRENAVSNVGEAVRTLRASDEKAAEAFRALLTLACRIIAESDDGLLEEESDLIRQLTGAAE